MMVIPLGAIKGNILQGISFPSLAASLVDLIKYSMDLVAKEE